MNTRIIKLVDCIDTLVDTNAPSEEIHNAIQHRNEILETEQYPPSDFEIIQEYLNSKGYSFDMIEVYEEYNW